MVDHRHKGGRKLPMITDPIFPTSIVTIDKFDGDYRFLSNFFLHDIVYQNLVYPSVEHLFQSLKTTMIGARVTVQTAATAGIAKKIGCKVPLRSDWEAIKQSVMMLAIRKKFSDNKLGMMLRSTYPSPLVEGNWWHDNCWGDCKCPQCKDKPGENLLGKILISVRKDLILGKPLFVPGFVDPEY